MKYLSLKKKSPWSQKLEELNSQNEANPQLEVESIEQSELIEVGAGNSKDCIDKIEVAKATTNRQEETKTL